MPNSAPAASNTAQSQPPGSAPPSDRTWKVADATQTQPQATLSASISLVSNSAAQPQPLTLPQQPVLASHTAQTIVHPMIDADTAHASEHPATTNPTAQTHIQQSPTTASIHPTATQSEKQFLTDRNLDTVSITYANQQSIYAAATSEAHATTQPHDQSVADGTLNLPSNTQTLRPVIAAATVNTSCAATQSGLRAPSVDPYANTETTAQMPLQAATAASDTPSSRKRAAQTDSRVASSASKLFKTEPAATPGTQSNIVLGSLATVADTSNAVASPDMVETVTETPTSHLVLLVRLASQAAVSEGMLPIGKNTAGLDNLPAEGHAKQPA